MNKGIEPCRLTWKVFKTLEFPYDSNNKHPILKILPLYRLKHAPTLDFRHITTVNPFTDASFHPTLNLGRLYGF